MTTPTDIQERRARDAAYARNRHRQIAYGRWNPWTDAQPVRDHIARLAEFGIGWIRAAELANLPQVTVSGWLYGSTGFPPPTKIRPHLAAKMLAVRATLDNVADGQHIDATGTRRRLQALVAIGYPVSWLAQQMDRDSSNFSRTMRSTSVEVGTARAASRLYEALRKTDPAEHGIPARSIRYAANWAAKQGWPTPEQWDDEIDDPHADPRAWVRDDSRMHRAEDLYADSEELLRYGIPIDVVATRLGVDLRNLKRARERAVSRARAAAGRTT